MTTTMLDRVCERVAAQIEDRDQSVEERYQRELTITVAFNQWLTAPDFGRLSPEEQEGVYSDYRTQLLRLRELSELRRPTALRCREETLAGEDLRGEVLELFVS